MSFQIDVPLEVEVIRNNKEEANDEHDYDERRYADLLQGLG